MVASGGEIGANGRASLNPWTLRTGSSYSVVTDSKRLPHATIMRSYDLDPGKQGQYSREAMRAWWYDGKSGRLFVRDNRRTVAMVAQGLRDCAQTLGKVIGGGWRIMNRMMKEG